MNLVIAVVVGFLAGRFVVMSGRDLLSVPALLRTNYRGHRLPTAGGLLCVFAVLLVEGLRTLIAALGVGHDHEAVRLPVLLGLVGFALLGLVDDLSVNERAHGFAGHLGALRAGRLTTGAVKLLGGGALALVVAASLHRSSGWRLLVDALVIALAANLANLLDLVPGRTVKFGLVAWVPIAAIALFAGAGSTPRLVGATAAVVVGAFGGLLFDDLREHLMLGDTGANALGAVLGTAWVAATSPTARVVAAVVLVAGNVLSEFMSFSRIIDRIGPLRRFDRAGSLR